MTRKQNDSEVFSILTTVAGALALLLVERLRWLGAALLTLVLAGFVWERRRKN